MTLVANDPKLSDKVFRRTKVKTGLTNNVSQNSIEKTIETIENDKMLVLKLLISISVYSAHGYCTNGIMRGFGYLKQSIRLKWLQF